MQRVDFGDSHLQIDFVMTNSEKNHEEQVLCRDNYHIIPKLRQTQIRTYISLTTKNEITTSKYPAEFSINPLP